MYLLFRFGIIGGRLLRVQAIEAGKERSCGKDWDGEGCTSAHLTSIATDHRKTNEHILENAPDKHNNPPASRLSRRPWRAGRSVFPPVQSADLRQRQSNGRLGTGPAYATLWDGVCRVMAHRVVRCIAAPRSLSAHSGHCSTLALNGSVANDPKQTFGQVRVGDICGREPILHSSVLMEGRSQEDCQMWLYVQTWLPLVTITLMAAICLSVAAFVMGQAKPRP